VYHPISWISPYFNYAETFNPPNTIQKIDSSFLPPTLARGTDSGVRFSFLGGKIVGQVDYYRNYEKNSSGGGINVGNINNLLQSAAVADPTIGRNIRSEPDVPAQATDVQDRYSQGYEGELTANFTPNWRAIFNFGIPRAYSENGQQFSIGYWNTHLAALKQIVTDAGNVVDPTTGLASANPSISAAAAPDQAMAMNAFNALVNQVNGFNFGRNRSTASNSMNIYTDYSFREGLLRGLRFGVGLNYRQARVIGNRGSDTIVDPNDPTKAIHDPRYTSNSFVRAPKPDRMATINIGYTVRLKDRREMTYTVTVRNALNQQDIWYTGSGLRPLNGDYTSPARTTVPTTFALRTPINFEFKGAYKY